MRPDLWLLVCLGVAGILFFFWKFQDSFPAASIDLKYNRVQIAGVARDWSRKVGYNPDGAVESTVFNLDDDAKTFLEYELGQKQANLLMKREIPVWSWVTRFCRPFQMEDIGIGLAPDGRLNYFSRTLPNDAPSRSLDHNEAEALARQFVTREAGASLEGTTTIKDSEVHQVRRTDHEFAWEDQSKDYRGARMRTYVCISGDQVTSFARYLHVPEKFQRKYADIRSYNLLLKQISEIVFTILSSAVTFIFIWAFASGRIRWPLALTAGGIAAVLSILNWFDSTPSLVADYHTTMSFQQYVLGRTVNGLMTAVTSGLATILFIGALEPVYRMAFPEKPALEKVPTAEGLRSRSVFRSLVAGLSVFGMHTAYVVGFYLIGQRFGFWSPMEIRETSLLSSLWPFYSAIDIGVSAATMEEFMYRVLALVMFKRLTRNFWLANLLQAAAWAFMHSDYPQEPAYARGVELTVGGFFYGFILRRFGLVACMLAHYTYDAFLGVTPLLSADALASKLTALVAVAPGILLLAASAWLIWRRGALADDSSLLNSAIPAGHKPEPRGPQPDTHFHYVPIKRWAVALCLVGGILGAVSQLCVPLATVGAPNVITISRQQATSIAREYLQSKGIDIASMRCVAAVSDDTDETELQYVFEKAGFEKTKQLALAKEPRLLWKVRFYKPGDPQEYYVSLTPEGKPYYKTVVAGEDTPGARPPAPVVRAAIDQFFQAQHQELMPVELVDSTKQERSNRTDHSFTYRVPALKVADAEFEVKIGTVGSAMSGFMRGWQIPESWKFERAKVTPKDQALDILRKVFFAGVLIWLIVWFVSIVRAGGVRWRASVLLATVTALVLAAGRLNGAPTVMWDYDTDVSVASFITSTLVQGLIVVLSGSALTGVVSALALTAYRQNFPNHPVQALLRATWPHLGKVTAATRRLWLDAIVIACGFTLLIVGVDHLFDFGQFLSSPTVRVLGLSAIMSATDEWSPALGAVLSAVSSAIAATLAVGIGAALWKRFFAGSRFKLPLFILAVDLIANSYLRYMQDYLWTVAAYLVMAALFYFLVRRLAGFNVLVYPLAAYFSTLVGKAYTLVRFQSFDLYYPQLAVIVLAVLAPLVYTGWLYLAPKRELEVMPPD